MSFYNKYRPTILSEIDNEDVRKTITSFLSKPKEDLPHAYFFTGPRGTGKTTTARIVAKLFNCLHPKKNGEPCGTCETCTAITVGNALDVMEIDAASNTGVDNIRDLKDKILLAPVQARWKVYIIDEVHMLSTGAFNALLKTLEEPPPHTLFILATTDLHKVPATIQSRCLHIHFNKPTIKEITGALERIANGEHITADKDSLILIAELADGSFRDAIKLLEQVSLQSQKITIDITHEVLKHHAESEVTTFITYVLKKDAAALIAQIETLSKSGADMRTFYADVLKTLQHMLISTTLKKDSTYPLPLLLETTQVLHSYYAESRYTNFPELTLQLATLSLCIQKQPISLSETQKHTTQHVQIKPISSTHVKPVHDSKPGVESEPPSLTDQEFSVEKLQQHWNVIIDEVKKANNSISGVLRSAKPKEIQGDTLIIETAYSFHKDKLSEPTSKEVITHAIKQLFGESIKLEIILIKK
jgi:DNA polymerase-3 subunit gamma/tau